VKYNAATPRTTLNIPVAFSFNHLYFNALYFNGFYISMPAYFNVHIFQFLMKGGSSLRDTKLFECPALAIASLTLMKGGSSLRYTTLIEYPAGTIDGRGKLTLQYYIDQMPGTRNRFALPARPCLSYCCT
jgi:hypothetical protein